LRCELGASLLCAGDAYYIDYLRPHTTYSLIIRAMSEVGLGAQLNMDVTTPDVSEYSAVVLGVKQRVQITL
jgi:hypothetical protein